MVACIVVDIALIKAEAWLSTESRVSRRRTWLTYHRRGGSCLRSRHQSGPTDRRRGWMVRTFWWCTSGTDGCWCALKEDKMICDERQMLQKLCGRNVGTLVDCVKRLQEIGRTGREPRILCCSEHLSVTRSHFNWAISDFWKKIPTLSLQIHLRFDGRNANSRWGSPHSLSFWARNNGRSSASSDILIVCEKPV